MRKKPAYFPNLDLLRLLAAFWVMGAHYWFVGPLRYGFDIVPSTEWLSTFFRYGYLGITLFFIISGYVISLTSVRSKALEYARRRIVRVIPALWICVTLSALVFWLFGWKDQDLIQRWFANLILLPQLFDQPFMDGVYWTLVYECIFYVWVFIFLALGIYHSKLELISLGWIIIALANQVWLQSGVVEKLFLTAHAGSFISGMLLWRISERGWRTDRMLLFVLAVAVITIGLEPLSIYQFPGGVVGPASPSANVLSAMGIVLLIVLAISIQPLISKRLAVFAGGLTYPLYLLHQEVGFAIFNVAEFSSHWLIFDVVVLVFGAAYAVYAIESNIRPKLDNILLFLGRLAISPFRKNIWLYKADANQTQQNRSISR